MDLTLTSIHLLLKIHLKNQICNPSTWQVKERRSGVQGPAQLQRKHGLHERLSHMNKTRGWRYSSTDRTLKLARQALSWVWFPEPKQNKTIMVTHLQPGHSGGGTRRLRNSRSPLSRWVSQWVLVIGHPGLQERRGG